MITRADRARWAVAGRVVEAVVIQAVGIAAVRRVVIQVAGMEVTGEI